MSRAPGVVVAPAGAPAADAEVTVDYVGNLANAAKVLKRLYLGEKRLVFCASRAKTEELASLLRAEGVTTFVSHSSLSAERRRDAEAAFRDGRNCVIVATSTLELGIDVGDLDRVIQIDAPATAGAFLQRLGRTGRRPGSRRNCLFPATSTTALLQAAALVELWREGFVEPIVPPSLPYHIFAQQVIALLLQTGGESMHGLLEALKGFRHAARLDRDSCAHVVEHMLAANLLASDSSVLAVGPEAGRLYGQKNYLNLLPVFDNPPLFAVYWGPKDLGLVHPISFQRRSDQGPVILSLGGRAWRVAHIDWDRHTAEVTPAEEAGKSRWLGETQPLSSRLCMVIRQVLLDDVLRPWWSNRASKGRGCRGRAGGAGGDEAGGRESGLRVGPGGLRGGVGRVHLSGQTGGSAKGGDFCVLIIGGEHGLSDFLGSGLFRRTLVHPDCKTPLAHGASGQAESPTPGTPILTNPHRGGRSSIE